MSVRTATKITSRPVTIEEIEEGQEYWTGDQWETVLRKLAAADSAMIVIAHRAGTGPVCATTYRRRRMTSVRLPSSTVSNGLHG